MPLITERPVPGWAHKLARQHDEPVREVLLEILLAIVKGELSAACRETTASDGLKQFILMAFDIMISQGSEDTRDLCFLLRPITITAVDMNHWLESRGIAIDKEEPDCNSIRVRRSSQPAKRPPEPANAPSRGGRPRSRATELASQYPDLPYNKLQEKLKPDKPGFCARTWQAARKAQKAQKPSK
jgi:hypothetical protein